MNNKTLKNICVATVLMTLFSALLISLPIQRVMATTTISSISPSGGFVGETIELNGTIDTSDGFFTIEWNQAVNVTGQASGVSVTKSFNVPQTVGAPSGRNITVKLIDDSTHTVAATNFTLFTKLQMSLETLPAPNQFQEGTAVNIAVNVTGGEANRIYTANLTVVNPANQPNSAFKQISNTTTTGFGQGAATYPVDFAGASTNHTGDYTVTFNATMPPQKFHVGLTDKLVYQRNETVQIQATGYHSSEVVTVYLKFSTSNVTGFPVNVTASSGGIVAVPWKIPLNTTRGTYNLSLKNSTSSGTVKTPPDVQAFNVTGFACTVETTNLSDHGVADVLVEVYNATSTSDLLVKGLTTSTGSILFNLNRGNYTFRAFFKDVEVGLLNQSITTDTDVNMPLSLFDILATVETESGEAVPSIDITLTYNYTTRKNSTILGTAFMQTNVTGVAETHNLFTNTTYLAEATRFGLPFNSTTFHAGLAPSSPLSLHFTLPTFTLNVHALDSQNESAGQVQIRIYEWASGVTMPMDSSETNNNGDASFLLLFGRYRLRAFKEDVLLNDTIIDLTENPTALTLNLIVANVKVKAFVSDYFGLPIANAEVKIESNIDQESVLVSSQFTGADGSTVFALPVGGNSRISVFVSGRLVAVNTQFLDGGVNQLTFRAAEFVAILGYPVEIGAFSLVSFIIVLIVFLIVVMRRRLAQVLKRRRKG